MLMQAYRVLAPGGEMYFSDVYCDRRLPPEVKKDEVIPLLSTCPDMQLLYLPWSTLHEP